MTDDPLHSSSLEKELATLTLPLRWEVHDILDSTNDRARLLLEQGAPEGTVVVADQQSQGKGRFGRQWVSDRGVGLYLSLVLKPPIPAGKMAPLTLLAGLAVAQTLSSLPGIHPKLKWPNDVILNGRKVAGILCELCMDEGAPGVVVGIGLNINQEMSHFPPPLDQTATSLQLATGQPQARVPIARELMLQFDGLYTEFLDRGPEMIRDRWPDFSLLDNQSVTVFLNGKTISGIARHVDDEGKLILETSEGRVALDSGEVTLRTSGEIY